jgi:hypothetical protein
MVSVRKKGKQNFLLMFGINNTIPEKNWKKSLIT